MSIRATFWRWRRLITAAFLALGIAVALAAVAPREGSSMIVVAEDLPAGHLLQQGDLTEASGPVVTTKSIDELAGQRISISLDKGTPVTDSMLIGPGLADSAPEGTVVAPVRLSTSKDIIPIGSTIDLYAPGEDDAELVATGATVLAFLDTPGNSPLGSNVPESTEALLALSRNEAMLVLGISARTPVLAVLHARTASS